MVDPTHDRAPEEGLDRTYTTPQSGSLGGGGQDAPGPVARTGGDEGRGEAEARGTGGERNRAGAEPTGDTPLDPDALAALPLPRRRTRRRVKPEEVTPRRQFTPEQRLVILDTWQRSTLPAKDFAPLVGISIHSLYKWKKSFEAHGPAGLQDKPRGRRSGSKLPDATRRAIVMLKEAHPEWGQDRIHAVLERTEGFTASPGAIGRVLAEAGYVVEDSPTRPHPDKVRRFERARPNQLWQTDLFTFVLKRENRRVHLVVYMDDHSRFIVGFGLHASSSGALVREVMEAAIANFGAPEEVLTDNGAQYHTWRGKSAFRKLMERRGIRQIVARPRHPQTLGKVERFWGTLWRECLEQAIFTGLEDARRRLALFVDHYNFQRPHSGIGGLVPADRFFAAAPQVRETLDARVAANSLELARNGVPRKAFYLTGRVGGQSISLHGEGEKVVLTQGDGVREEVDLTAPGRRDDGAQEQVLPVPVSGAVSRDADPPRDAEPEVVVSGEVEPGGTAPDPEGDLDDEPSPEQRSPEQHSAEPHGPEPHSAVGRMLSDLRGRLLGHRAQDHRPQDHRPEEGA